MLDAFGIGAVVDKFFVLKGVVLHLFQPRKGILGVVTAPVGALQHALAQFFRNLFQVAQPLPLPVVGQLPRTEVFQQILGVVLRLVGKFFAVVQVVALRKAYAGQALTDVVGVHDDLRKQRSHVGFAFRHRRLSQCRVQIFQTVAGGVQPVHFVVVHRRLRSGAALVEALQQFFPLSLSVYGEKHRRHHGKQRNKRQKQRVKSFYFVAFYHTHLTRRKYACLWSQAADATISTCWWQ